MKAQLATTAVLWALVATVSVAVAHPWTTAEVEDGLVAIAAPASSPIKCGTPLLQSAMAARAQLSPDGLRTLEKLLGVATLDQSFSSIGGHFVINYSIAGPDSVPVTDDDSSGVPDYVEWVAEAFDQSWQTEITDLGFATIPLGTGERYVVNLSVGGNLYGYTNTGPYPGGTYIALHRDFASFYRVNPYLIADDPDGAVRGGIRVTAAHELKHAIQYVRSQWSEPSGWVELDATFMEDVVFDQVNDYTNYLDNPGSPFTAPTTSLTLASYEDSTWEHYLLERWGWPVIHRYWIRRGQVYSGEAPELTYRVAAQQEGLDWVGLWGEYQAWNYASGLRKTADFGFAEADSFPTPPVVAIANSNQYQSPSYSLNFLSARYHELDNSARERKGEATLHFDGNPNYAWSTGLLLQNDGQSTWLPMMVSAGVGSLTTTGVGMELYDRIAFIAGNATTLTGSASYTFHFSTTDTAIVQVEQPSFGGLKGRYLPPPKQ